MANDIRYEASFMTKLGQQTLTRTTSRFPISGGFMNGVRQNNVLNRVQKSYCWCLKTCHIRLYPRLHPQVWLVPVKRFIVGHQQHKSWEFSTLSSSETSQIYNNHVRFGLKEPSTTNSHMSKL